MDPGNRRAIIAAFLANAGIAVLKFIGWGITGAASLLAEAVHSVADASNQGLLIWGNNAARRAPTPAHSFGHGRERYFWAFVVSLVIFSLGGLFALYEGLDKIIHPHALTQPAWALGILATGVLFEGLSLRTAVKAARQKKGESSWWAYIRRTKNPELPVILLEDLGALLGLILALLGIGLSAWTGDPRFDALGSVAIGVLLVIIAALLSVEMKSLLIGESANPENEELIRSAMLAHESVRRLIHLRTQHIAPDQILVGAKIEFDEGSSFNRIAKDIDAIEMSIREVLPFSAMIYIEPAVYADETSASGEEKSRPDPPATSDPR
ncbi:MAG: cation diffusion facilitator family transporter [Myxococcota bacterium]|nr:cation diffusion facilitator family transporter [Myxococcota bacterium]